MAERASVSCGLSFTCSTSATRPCARTCDDGHRACSSYLPVRCCGAVLLALLARSGRQISLSRSTNSSGTTAEAAQAGAVRWRNGALTKAGVRVWVNERYMPAAEVHEGQCALVSSVQDVPNMRSGCDLRFYEDPDHAVVPTDGVRAD